MSNDAGVFPIAVNVEWLQSEVAKVPTPKVFVVFRCKNM
jgi:hypothetical protein